MASGGLNTVAILENGRSGPLFLDHATIAAVRDLKFRKRSDKEGSSVLGVEVSSQAGAVHLVARDVVGTVRIRGLQVSIQPKCGVHKLAHMLIESGAIPHQVPESVFVESGDLIRYLAEHLIYLVEEYVRVGVAEGYAQVAEVGVRPRGRIDFAWSRGGLSLPVRYRFEEYSEDIVENRLVASALESILGTYGLRDEVGEKAALLREHFGARLSPLDDIERVVEDSEHGSLLQMMLLARTIVQGSGVEPEAGDFAAIGILFWMPSVYEGYLSNLIQRAVRTVSLHVDLKGSLVKGYTAAGNKMRLFPDFLVTQNGRPILVGDIKYKFHKKTPPRPDIYQMFAYSEVYDVGSSVLFYVGHRKSESIIMNNKNNTFLEVVSLDIDGLELNEIALKVKEALRVALVRAGILAPPPK